MKKKNLHTSIEKSMNHESQAQYSLALSREWKHRLFTSNFPTATEVAGDFTRRVDHLSFLACTTGRLSTATSGSFDRRGGEGSAGADGSSRRRFDRVIVVVEALSVDTIPAPKIGVQLQDGILGIRVVQDVGVNHGIDWTDTRCLRPALGTSVHIRHSQ